jgi:hypothetical protein
MINRFIKNSQRGAITEIISVIILLVGGYGLFLYVPLVYKSQQLEDLAKEYTYKTNSASVEMIKEAIIADASDKVGAKLLPDDVIVSRENDRAKIKIIWRPIIRLPFGYTIPRVFTVEYDRKLI